MLATATFVFGSTVVVALDSLPLAFTYLTTDSVQLQVYMCRDSNGVLDGYTSHILTPVCEGDQCHDAEADFYWDILGKFSHYKWDRKQPLTKQDHVAFSQEDHIKLHSILHTPSPSFIHLRRDELITPKVNKSGADIDGLTGATVQAVSRDMVQGAVYTCYTLWHIANGGLVFKIQEHTKENLTDCLLLKLLDTPSPEAHYFLIQNIESSKMACYIDDLLTLAGQYDPYFSSQLVSRLSPFMLEGPHIQSALAEHFPQLEYAAQLDLLAMFKSCKNLSVSGQKLLADHMAEDSQINRQIIALICHHADPNRLEGLQYLLDHMIKKGISVSTHSLRLLKSIPDRIPILESKIVMVLSLVEGED